MIGMPGSVALLASLLRGDCPVHLSLFLLAGLGEHRQQYQPSARCQPVAQPYLTAMQVEPKLAGLAA